MALTPEEKSELDRLERLEKWSKASQARTEVPEESTISGEAAKGAGVGAGIYGAARAARPLFQAMTRAPVPGLPGMAVKGIGALGTALGTAPIESVLSGAAAGGASEAARKYGVPEPYASAVGFGAGMVPAGAKAGARSLYENVLGTPSEVAQGLAKVARSKGIELEPAAVRQMDKSSRTGADPVIARKNQKRINELASETTGQKSEKITSDFIGKRLDNLGSEFDKIIKTRNFEIRPEEMSDAIKLFIREVDALKARVPLAQDVAERILSGRPLKGDELQRLRTELGQIVRRSLEPTDVHVAGQAIELLDDVVESQLRREGTKGSADLAKLAEVRPQYRATKTLQNVLRRDGISPEGDLSAERLGNYLRQRDYQYSSGQSTNPLAELGQIGETFQLRGIYEPQLARGGEEAAKSARETGKAIGKIVKYGAAPALGFSTGGVPGMLMGGAGSLGLASTESLARMAAAGKPGQVVQETFAPAMRGTPKPVSASVIPPAAATGVGAATTPTETFNQDFTTRKLQRGY